MQVFELHFNPNINKEKVFDAFVYEPQNLYEKRFGSLYMAGELSKPLLRNPKFLSLLFSAIKNEYYGSQLKSIPENSFKKAINKANNFLDEESKKGNVGWLGNLSFVIINHNNSNLIFTKTGNIKIILIRRGEFIDISESLNTESKEDYQLKIFNNIAFGKLNDSDKLMVLTNDAFLSFSKNNDFLKELNTANNEKSLNEIIKKNKPLFSKNSGICLLMTTTNNYQNKRSITFEKELSEFTFKESLIKPLLSLLLKIKLPKLINSNIRTSKIKKRETNIKIPSLKLPNWNTKNIKLIISSILFITLSFYLFRQDFKEKEKDNVINSKENQEIITAAKEKIMMAENFIIFKKNKEAAALFQEAINLLDPLTQLQSPLQNEALQIENRAQNKLDSIIQEK